MQNQSLIAYRKTQGLTQEEMADKLEISESFYQKIENGERNPSYNFITKFKKVFNQANTDNLFFDTQLHETCDDDALSTV